MNVLHSGKWVTLVYKDVHNTARNTVGHLGINKTLKKIMLIFYWPGIKKAVIEFVPGCERSQCMNHFPWTLQHPNPTKGHQQNWNQPNKVMLDWVIWRSGWIPMSSRSYAMLCWDQCFQMQPFGGGRREIQQYLLLIGVTNISDRGKGFHNSTCYLDFRLIGIAHWLCIINSHLKETGLKSNNQKLPNYIHYLQCKLRGLTVGSYTFKYFIIFWNTDLFYKLSHFTCYFVQKYCNKTKYIPLSSHINFRKKNKMPNVKLTSPGVQPDSEEPATVVSCHRIWTCNITCIFQFVHITGLNNIQQ